MPNQRSTESIRGGDGALGGPPASHAPAPPEFSPGTLVGEYELCRFIGAGGMGEVYEGRREGREVRYAIKILAPTGDDREGRLHEMADHPHVVAIHDRGTFLDTQGRNRHFLVMRLVRGARSLTDHADHRRLGLEQRVGLIIDVCRAVEALHPKVCHYDLKPSNILVGDDGVVQISDLGLARLSTDLALTRPGGTTVYASPEQLTLPVADLDHRADQYALACTLYELVTGRTPVVMRGDMSAADVLKAKEQAPASMSRTVPEVDDALDAIVRRGLWFSRDDRYPDTRAFREALEGWRASRRHLRAGVTAWSRRHPVATAWLATALAALASTAVSSLASRPIADRLRWERHARIEAAVTPPSFEHVVLVPMPSGPDAERLAREAGVRGVVATDFRTSRLLMAALCDRAAGTARVIALDMYFSATRDEDAEFSRAISDSFARATPVVILPASPILDQAGIPNMPPRLWESGVRWGFGTIVPAPGERGVPLLLQTNDFAMPSFALAILAAWHQPGALPRYSLSPRDTIEIAFAPPHPSRSDWVAPVIDRREILPSSVQAPQRDAQGVDALWRREGAAEAFLRVDAPPPATRQAVTISMRDLLLDDTALLRCRSKIVMLYNPADTVRGDASQMPSAFVHASAIEAVLSGRVLRLATWSEQLLPMLGLGWLGGLLGIASAVGPARSAMPRLSASSRPPAVVLALGTFLLAACVIIVALHFAALIAAESTGILFSPIPGALSFLLAGCAAALVPPLLRPTIARKESP